MSFVETPRLPDRFRYGATGGPEFSTDIVTLDSGWEQSNIRWDLARRRYQVQGVVLEQYREEWLDWFEVMRARGHRFRLRDWGDYQVDVTRGRLGTSPNGTGATTYQLTKYRTVGSLSVYRPIRKPAYLQPIQLYRGGVLQTNITHYALDTTTGIVTFVTPPSSGETLTWSGEFDVPCRFDNDYGQMTFTAPGIFGADQVTLIEVRT